MTTDSEVLDSLIQGLGEFARQHAPLLIFLLVLLVLVQSVRLAWVSGAGRRRIAAHKALGEEGERKARALLERNGYRILDDQKSGQYALVVDDESSVVHLRADYVVRKKGRTFVAEVKSGGEAVKVTGRATRRQLLEYMFAFDVSGVLLVNMVERRVVEVQFPPIKGRTRAART